MANGINLDRFLKSLQQDGYWAWHDGVDYDIAALTQLTPDERDVALAETIRQRAMQAANVEVFEVIATPAAVAELQRYAANGEPIVKLLAVRALSRLQKCPQKLRNWLITWFADPDLTEAGFIPLQVGLPAALKQADSPELRAAMISTVARGGAAAPYLGALLLRLMEIAPVDWAWGSFPFLQTLDSGDQAARAAALRAFRNVLGNHAGGGSIR